MAPPTKLAVHVSAVERLVKEEQSYHKEMHLQEKRIAKHRETIDTQENAEFLLNQEVSLNLPPHPSREAKRGMGRAC